MTSNKTNVILQMVMETGLQGDLSQYVNAPLLQKNEKPLEGQAALITGATRLNGIGFAIAERLALDGVSPLFIVGTTNSRDLAPFTVQRLERYGGKVQAFIGNITEEKSCAEIIKEAYSIAGNVNVLINNAGTNLNKPITDVTLEDFYKVFNPKALGALLMSREWFNMRNRKGLKGGRVVNIGSSVGSLYGNYGQTPYAMANGALFGLTQALALEFGTRGVTVNLVAPTFVEGTDISNSVQDQIVVLKATTPNGQLPNTQDIANAVAFLVSPDAAHINGTVLSVDEGMKSNYTALRPLGRARFTQASPAGLRIASTITKEETDMILASRSRKGQI